jgi:hypothetical protein
MLICDRCGFMHHYTEGGMDIAHVWRYEIFFKRPKPSVLYSDFCKSCAIAITPIVYLLRDVDELWFYVNKLKRTINEHKRNENKNNRELTRIVGRYY